MFLIDLIPVTWRVGILVASVVAFIGFCTYERVHFIDEGKKEATQEIQNANAREKQKADAGSHTVDSCFAAGGIWDRVAGVCDHAPGQ